MQPSYWLPLCLLGMPLIDQTTSAAAPAQRRRHAPDRHCCTAPPASTASTRLPFHAADGDLLAVSTPDNRVALYQRLPGGLQQLCELEGHEATISQLHFSGGNGSGEWWLWWCELQAMHLPVSSAQPATCLLSPHAPSSPTAGLRRLVSSSHDRNSYVWTQPPQQQEPQQGEAGTSGSTEGTPGSSQKWQPELVITKLRKAGLSVAWAPGTPKFAIGASERAADVCYLDANRSLWAPRLIKKKHASAVMVRLLWGWY